VNRRELLKLFSQALIAIPLFDMSMISSCGRGKTSSTPASPGSSYTGTDDQLLDDIERASFQFFWNQAGSGTGLVKDRANATRSDSYTAASIASTGFGLTALCIGDQRGYGAAADIKARVLTTLRYVANQLTNVHGFYYHFIDWQSGARMFNSEVSSIDTALFLCGVLTCRQYYASDSEIVNLATQIYNRVDWPWMLNGGSTLSMGWTPESGFLAARWDTYCELMMIYLLGIGSPSNPLAPATWKAWSRPTVTYQGYTYISGAPTLFTHQFSHAWFDFRNKRDDYTNYFQNSVLATQAHKAFCISLQPQFSDYTDALWGITASDSVNGYVAWGGPPKTGPIDGSVVPCAAGGSVAFLPQDCLQVLRTIRTTYGAKAWGRYSFVDAFNPLTNWYNADVIGIDLGIAMLMAENYRSGFVWQTFMKNPEVQNAMTLAGFTNTSSSKTLPSK